MSSSVLFGSEVRSALVRNGGELQIQHTSSRPPMLRTTGISVKDAAASPSAIDPRPALRERALALGFDACGFASVKAPWPAAGRLEEFIAQGRHGSMEWMATTAQRRSHPRAMWAEAR